MSASEDTQAACRSRAITCEEIAAGFSPSRCADPLFSLRPDMPEGSHGARDLPDAQVFGGRFQTSRAARHFVIPERQFQTESNRLGVDAVGPPDLDRVLEFISPALKDLRQSLAPSTRILDACFSINAWAVSTTSLDVRP